MTRWVFSVLLLCTVTASRSAGQPSPATANHNRATVAAKQAFDQLQQQWVDLTVKLQQKHKDKVASGSTEPGPIDVEIQKLRAQTEAMVDKIVAAGLEVHRGDPQSYPSVNSTLEAIAGFYVTGDSNGDGGDQYEKALPIIDAILATGTEEEFPNLMLWGGVSAYCLNKFDLAQKYLQGAQRAGLLTDLPARPASDPAIRTRQYAAGCLQSLPEVRQAWQQEQEIRQAEAKAGDLPRVKFHTTRGDVVIELFENEAPQAVANFITLVNQGYYDDVVFHRVLPQFMAQGGDPTGTGSGGPGYSIRCECHGTNYRKHFRGSLSMAHAGRDTGGSQFFLTFVPTSYLDGRHTVFGRVAEGMEAAAALKRRNPEAEGQPQPDKIVNAHVLRDRGHEYEFEKLPER